VEYATREQAQNAVATLSNQNLMGRLVYVREVSLCPDLQFLPTSEPTDQWCRIERRNLDSSVRRAEIAADSALAWHPADIPQASLVPLAALLAVVDVRST
jgi:hypothetical protein